MVWMITNKQEAVNDARVWKRRKDNLVKVAEIPFQD